MRSFFAAGLVGGLGSRHARAVGGHAFYNSATIIPETHSVPHGTQVAYGLLLQLALENKTGDIKALLPFYKAIGLPVSVHDLNLDDLDSLEKVAIKMAEPVSLIHGLPRQVTALDILEAVRTVREMAQTVLTAQE
ncbi:iron-containing alcohol dehydrogenase [Terrilactibacillus sp. S3-3]|nr:iron-containing alcohol dehydrogenase [Terrilactibacillus sp. S3-3]